MSCEVACEQAGDVDADGIDEVGLHRESTGLVYYRLTLITGAANASFIWGNPDDRIIGGNWNASGTDTVGLFRPSTTTVFLRNSNSAGPANVEYAFGSSTWQPVAGRFGLG